MKRMIGLLMMVGLMGAFIGCGGDSDSPTGPQGQNLEVRIEKWDNGNIKVEFQFYRDGGSVVKHGWYKDYDETGNLIDEDTYREGSCVESCEWRKTFGDGEGRSVQQTVDGGFIVTGVDNEGVFYSRQTNLETSKTWMTKTTSPS